MKRHRTPTLIVSLLAAALCLYGTSAAAKDKKPPPTVTIRMTEAGRIYVGDTYTGLKGLVPHLKRKRFPSSTRITIDIPQNASDQSIKQIGQTLASGNYFSMRFRKPRASVARKAPLPGAPLSE